MTDIVEQLRQLSTAPSDDEAFRTWIEQRDALEFLRANARQAELVVYASFRHAFIHAVSVRSSRVDSPDVEDLLKWNFGADSSWGISSGGSDATLEPPLSSTGSKTLDGGDKLVFPRSFEGLIGEKNYVEVLQPFVHAFELHFVRERSAYCRLDSRGDLEEFVRIVSFGPDDPAGGMAILFRRSLLDEWMLLKDAAIVQTFDFTRFRISGFSGWSNDNEPTKTVSGDIIYRSTIQSGYASYIRGVQIVRPIMTKKELLWNLGWGKADDGKHASFIAYDFKNNVVREMSCAPGETANYFTKSDLPFETSPAFFRPEVLQKYKGDSDKYRLEERSISCRGAWHLQTYDINEAGQVHTYICYLRDLPYDEQLYWKSYNEPPRAPISKRALTTDFKGEWHREYDSLPSLKDALDGLRSRRVPWWKLRSDKLVHQVHYPITSSADEWATELLQLDQLLVEGFEEKWLRKRAHTLGRKPDPRFMSLKLIEECLIGLGYEEEHARRITAPLHNLHYLRSKVKGHASGEDATTIKRDALVKHKTYGKHFQALCAECDEAVRSISEAFKDFN